ncbi:type IVB secretion system protein IcmM/DotJ [Legionella fairfieldensis]|uniref:type IVB secretion system protein IcmM/DotJ n=1 Tax=Legionella fairfieldensis TaxID=45064 RepID=UPI00048ACA26|nr:type IVB secretion system protein IcmM/DotJ [Legionella fairfieldensis]
MTQETWNTIKKSKNFYVRTYRMAIKWLIVSLAMNFLMVFANYYLYFHQPQRDFYATSGIVPPVKLKPMSEPNYSATPLLEPDPPNDNDIKVIPQ